jgi:hypothetical protein
MTHTGTPIQRDVAERALRGWDDRVDVDYAVAIPGVKKWPVTLNSKLVFAPVFEPMFEPCLNSVCTVFAPCVHHV